MDKCPLIGSAKNGYEKRVLFVAGKSSGKSSEKPCNFRCFLRLLSLKIY
jgi:hypothetical protein